MKIYISTNSSFRLMKTYFLSSGNSMLLFGTFFLQLETMTESRVNQCQQKTIFLLVENIFDFFARRSSFSRIVETYFSTNASFQVVETDFFTNPSFQLSEKDFLFSGNGLLYLRVLSY